MMRRFASRSSRIAVYFADVLLIALAPALFFYPAYFWLVPDPPKANLLPLDLMNTPEKELFEAKLASYQQGLITVGLGTVAVFFLVFILYQMTALLLPARDGSSRGQTFGMRAVSTRVLQISNQPIAFHHALLRSIFFALSSALFLASLVISANLLVFLVLDDSQLPLDLDPENAWELLSLCMGVIALHLLALIPKRSLIDLASGTCQTALYGDLVEKEHK
jgi:uncharacterized RDD family membrane protein YckC